MMTLAAAAWAGPSNPADDPTISLVKTIELREFEGLKFNTDEYTVKAGDNLYHVLLQRGVVGAGPTPDQALRLIRALNQDIKNPDIIVPGQKLILPSGPVEGLSPAPKTPAVAAKTAGPTEPGTDAAKAPETPAASNDPGKEPGEDAAPGQADVRYPSLKDAAAAALADSTKHVKIKIKPGDRLAQLLRDQGISNEHIFNEYLNLTVAMNPGINHADVIYSHMELNLPTTGAAMEARVGRMPVVASRTGKGSGGAAADSGRLAFLPKVDPSVVKAPERKRPPDSKPNPNRLLAPPPAIPDAASMGTRTALGLIFTRMGEQFLAKGQLFLPLREGGQITLDTHSFPVIEMSSGHRIVLDLDRRLPDGMVELIRGNWSQYSVYRPRRGERLPETLQNLIELGGYYRVQHQGAPWVFSKDVRVQFNADWIIWPTEVDYRVGRPTIINLASGTQPGLSAELTSYLEEQGIKIIHFQANGNLIGPGPRRAATAKTKVNITNLRPGNNRQFMLSVLDMVGQKYETDLSVPLVTGSRPGDGFNVTIEAPIYFSRGGKNHIVTFDPLSTEMVELLKRNNFNVILCMEGEGAQGLAQKLLSAMGMKTESGLTLASSGDGKKNHFEVSMPGVLFNMAGRQTLLTNSHVPSTLEPLLSRPNLTVVRYQIHNAS